MNYFVQSLGQTQENILWSQYGEVLRTTESSDVNLNYLNKILKNEIYCIFNS